jgi:hypothetical protein
MSEHEEIPSSAIWSDESSIVIFLGTLRWSGEELPASLAAEGTWQREDGSLGDAGASVDRGHRFIGTGVGFKGPARGRCSAGVLELLLWLHEICWMMMMMMLEQSRRVTTACIASRSAIHEIVTPPRPILFAEPSQLSRFHHL